MQDENGIDSEWIHKLIRDFLNDPEENRLFDDGDERAWADPLVGFSRGDDPVLKNSKATSGPLSGSLSRHSLRHPRKKIGRYTII